MREVRGGLSKAIDKDEELRRARAAARKPGRRPKVRRDSRPTDELTVEDLRRYPVWQFDLSAEDGHDETWVKPVKRLPVSDLSNRVVGTEACMACDDGLSCLLGNSSLDHAERTEQFLGLTAFRTDGERFHLARSACWSEHRST